MGMVNFKTCFYVFLLLFLISCQHDKRSFIHITEENNGLQTELIGEVVLDSFHVLDFCVNNRIVLFKSKGYQLKLFIYSLEKDSVLFEIEDHRYLLNKTRIMCETFVKTPDERLIFKFVNNPRGLFSVELSLSDGSYTIKKYNLKGKDKNFDFSNQIIEVDDNYVCYDGLIPKAFYIFGHKKEFKVETNLLYLNFNQDVLYTAHQGDICYLNSSRKFVVNYNYLNFIDILNENLQQIERYFLSKDKIIDFNLTANHQVSDQNKIFLGLLGNRGDNIYYLYSGNHYSEFLRRKEDKISVLNLKNKEMKVFHIDQIVLFGDIDETDSKLYLSCQSDEVKSNLYAFYLD